MASFHVYRNPYSFDHSLYANSEIISRYSIENIRQGIINEILQTL